MLMSTQVLRTLFHVLLQSGMYSTVQAINSWYVSLLLPSKRANWFHNDMFLVGEVRYVMKCRYMPPNIFHVITC